MALTVDQLAIHLNLIESGSLPEPDRTKLTLLHQAAAAEVLEYAGEAQIPTPIMDIATVRLASYLWDEAPSRRNKNLNPLRASGAMALLVRHREIQVDNPIVITDEQLAEDGFTQNEINRLKELAANSDSFLRLEM